MEQCELVIGPFILKIPIQYHAQTVARHELFTDESDIEAFERDKRAGSQAAYNYTDSLRIPERTTHQVWRVSFGVKHRFVAFMESEWEHANNVRGFGNRQPSYEPGKLELKSDWWKGSFAEVWEITWSVQKGRNRLWMTFSGLGLPEDGIRSQLEGILNAVSYK